MKSEIITPNITQIKLQFEREEDMYSRCMWARINFDNDNYSLSAETDCGAYSYCWQPTEEESFLKLMCRINKHYLIDKVASENVFDCDETTKTFIKYYNELLIDEKLLEQIKQIDTSSLQGYIEEIHFLDHHSIFNDSGIYECACYKYPYGAVTFCELFEKHVQPLIKQFLKENQHGK